ncbi:MAG: filamentous hemagglutinin N-terminal domain-containing protein, partial [Cyanobacteria bacterium J06639_16]
MAGSQAPVIKGCPPASALGFRGALLLLCTVLCQQPGLAQIVPDNTLGSESSVVPDGAASGTLPNVLIEGGAQQNTTLFHSFEQFNINAGQQVRFFNPDGVENIFSRVTGGDLSNIDGLLGVNGLANLFFLNPNGVIFGPNAQLDLSGAFVVSTAEHFLFPDGSTFSAVNPEAEPLLTLSVPVGLQFGRNPQPIAVNGANLRMPTGQPLALLGGDITLDGASLRVSEGRLALGGLSEPGILTLNLEAAVPQTFLTVPADVSRANVTINDTRAETHGGGNGDIIIAAQNLTLTASQLEAGITENSGTPDSQAGDIILDATGDIQLLQGSRIINLVRDNALGEGGGITISASNLNLTDRSDIATETFSRGRAGDILIEVDNRIVVQDGDLVDPNPPSDRPPQGPRTFINSASRAGAGGTGNLILRAQDIILEGRVRIEINNEGIQTGGSIDISSDSLQVLRGGSMNNATNGPADAGNIRISANDVLIDDRGSGQSGQAGIDSTVGRHAQNTAGGTVFIDTQNLTIVGSRVGATVQGQGDGGRVVIRASDTVRVTGDQATGRGSIASAIRDSGSGTGGDIDIKARNLILENGADINASASGDGIGGEIGLRINDAIIFRRTLAGKPSRITTELGPGATGAGSDITIETAQLIVEDGGQISAATLGDGLGGNVTIRATQGITLTGVADSSDDRAIGSGIFAGSPGPGTAGDINVTTPDLIVRDRAQISVSSTVSGVTGGITANVNNLILDNGSISADAVEGDDADIDLFARETVQLLNGSRISTNASGT